MEMALSVLIVLMILAGSPLAANASKFYDVTVESSNMCYNYKGLTKPHYLAIKEYCEKNDQKLKVDYTKEPINHITHGVFELHPKCRDSMYYVALNTGGGLKKQTILVDYKHAIKLKAMLNKVGFYNHETFRAA